MKDTDIVEYRLDEKTTVMIEVERRPSAPQSAQRISRGGGTADAATNEVTRRFDEALEGIRPAAERVLKVFQEMNTPEEISLEFGLKFGAKAGVILASADSEATFKVALRWKNERKDH
jgi:hypothetical protein